MKYKLINKTTGEEHICEKVTIDGWDYYVSDENIHVGDYYLTFTNKIVMGDVRKCEDSSYNFTHCKKVIATNNPNIDIPKVVDEVEILTEKFIGCKYEDIEDSIDQIGYDSFKRGYNKSQETHPFSEEDMIEFLNWIRYNTVFDSAPKPYHRKTQTRLSQEELLQLWKEQRPKTLYYDHPSVH